ncbi:putative two-component histidine kinase [Gordonia aichiensis NBRC 108223]|uniref:histidine kinase n=2 Tax=Gordonia aichiensis TaxID=36820 RepID=L7KN59_9ACTN|nr:putative two-component histidine kinase [Gordonia aichiensis NBRC 108223]
MTPRHTVSVTVSDDGPGIPDGEKSRVTDRFVRLDTSRQRGSGGSGLGLSIVTEIVRAHGGVVVIEDSDYGGASVGFRLPLQQMDTQSPPSSANR